MYSLYVMNYAYACPLPLRTDKPTERWRVQSGLSRARFVRDDVRSRASRVNLLLREARAKYLQTNLARRLWKCKSTRRPVDKSITHMDPLWKDPFTCFVAGPTGRGKTTSVARLLRNASTVIDPSSEHVGVDGTQLCLK